uniref:Uncharacterized protein n=1 Tax=Percolomonas cosmopolitus TaxID=63605 RepID=A0A7S1KTZ2_9EUKA
MPSLDHLTSKEPSYLQPQPPWRSKYLPHHCRHIVCRHFTAASYQAREKRCMFRFEKERALHEEKEHGCDRNCDICKRQRKLRAQRSIRQQEREEHRLSVNTAGGRKTRPHSAVMVRSGIASLAEYSPTGGSPMSGRTFNSTSLRQSIGGIKSEYPLDQLRELLDLNEEDCQQEHAIQGTQRDHKTRSRPASALPSHRRFQTLKQQSRSASATLGSGVAISKKRPMSATLAKSSYLRRKSYQIDSTSLPIASRRNSSQSSVSQSEGAQQNLDALSEREVNTIHHHRPSRPNTPNRSSNNLHQTGSSGFSLKSSQGAPNTPKRPLTACSRYRLRVRSEMGTNFPTAPSYVSSYSASVDPVVQDFRTRDKVIAKLEKSENEVPLTRRGSWCDFALNTAQSATSASLMLS